MFVPPHLLRRNLSIRIWTPIKLCSCCGKFVVKLRLPGWGTKGDPRWYIVCFFKGWDGNPWYVQDRRWTHGNATPHPRKRYAQRMYGDRPKQEPVDPFFTLDGSL
jgi:hypothetical protein